MVILPHRGRTASAAVAVLLAAALGAGAAGCTRSSPSGVTGSPAATGRPVSLTGTEVRTLASKATGTRYDLQIAYPEGYSPGGGTTYPVLYQLDGQWDFPVLRAVYQNQVYDGTVPELVVVGITYAGASPDYGRLRAHDLTPVADPSEPGSGGAAAFLQFVRDELIPYVESHLAADPARRYLSGSSYGGLFTLWTMYSDPGLFAGYLASSPAVTAGGGELDRVDAAFAASGRPLATRLFVCVGTAERLHAPVLAYLDRLAARHYQGLRLSTRELDGEGHAGGKTEAYSRGLRELFAAA